MIPLDDLKHQVNDLADQVSKLRGKIAELRGEIWALWIVGYVVFFGLGVVTVAIIRRTP